MTTLPAHMIRRCDQCDTSTPSYQLHSRLITRGVWKRLCDACTYTLELARELVSA